MAYAAVVGYLESISSAVVWTVAIGLLLSVSAAETRFFHALPAAHEVWLNTQNCARFRSQIGPPIRNML